MKLLKKLQNRHFAAGVKHGRVIGIQCVEALLNAELKVLKANLQKYEDLEPRINEVQFMLAKIRRLYDHQ